jgi:hypothetical protein
MNSKFLSRLKIVRQNNRFATFCALGIVIFLITALSIQTASQAAGQKSKSGKVRIPFASELELMPTGENQVIEADLSTQDGLIERSSITPLAIPAGTPLSSVTFLGIAFRSLTPSSSVTAIADTNGDLVPDASASEDFIASTDPANEIIPSMAIGKKSGRFYIAVMAGAGSKKGSGEIIVAENSANFRATAKTTFSAGRGTPIGMVVLDTPMGDVLIVASVDFRQSFSEFNESDSLRIVAYLPGPDGFPDGNMTKTILAPGSKLGKSTINRSIGGIALDSRGNLYVNVATQTAEALGGAIMAFSDSDGDLIPDKGVIFAAGSTSDPNAATASSIIPIGNGRFAIFALSLLQGQRNQIVIYTDADGDLIADGPPKIFSTIPSDFKVFIFGFGPGASTFASTHMDFADGQALIAFIRMDTSGAVNDSGLALIKDDGTGKGGAPMKILEAPKDSRGNFSIFTLVLGVPRVPDLAPPTVKVNRPNGGEMVKGGTQLNISFTSSDNLAVVSHDISLSTDGGATFPITVTRGLSGSTQSFSFLVPPTLETTMARIQVTAKDDAGNFESDISDANFTIRKSEVVDTQKPTVTVTSPKTKDKLKGGQTFTVTFTSRDDTGIVSHEIQLSRDEGRTFSSLATGVAGNLQSFQVNIPNEKVKKAVIKVIAKDAAGNAGEGVSGVFKIKKT